MEKRNVGRAILGFFISFFIVCLLIAEGLLIGLKFTIFKGTDVVDILQNANMFGMVSELYASELEATMGDEPMMRDVVSTVFTEEMLTEITSDMTQAIVNGEEVDLSGVAKECLNSMESTSDAVIEQLFDEVTANGEINISALGQSEILKSYEQQFGMELAPWVEGYVSDTYGDTTIKIDEEQLAAIKNETKTALKEEIMPALEEAMEIYIEDINSTVNQELQAMNEQYHVAEIIQLIESIMDMMMIAIVVLLLLVILLIVVELLVYKNAMSRGVRNIGVSAIFAALMIALIGAVTSIANSFLVGVVGMAGMAGDATLEVLMSFIEANLQKLGMGFLLIAVVYFGVAVICLVLSSNIKKTEKSWN